MSTLRQEHRTQNAEHAAVPPADAADRGTEKCLHRRWDENAQEVQHSRYEKVDHVVGGRRDSA